MCRRAGLVANGSVDRLTRPLGAVGCLLRGGGRVGRVAPGAGGADDLRLASILMTKYQIRPTAVQTRNTYGSALKEPTRAGKMSFGIAVGIQLT